MLAMSGIDDHDARTAVAGHELLAADLVDDDNVCLGQVLRSPDGHQAWVTRTGAHEGDATRMARGHGRCGQFFDGRVGSAHKARSGADRSGRGSKCWTCSVTMFSVTMFSVATVSVGMISGALKKRSTVARKRHRRARDGRG